MERVKAGADFKEFNTLRGNFATELSIIRDRMSSGSSAKDPLRRYYAAYQDVLDLYSFAASVWRQKISFDECVMGPTLSPGDPRDLDGFFAFQDRFQICWKSHGGALGAPCPAGSLPENKLSGFTRGSPWLRFEECPDQAGER